VAFASNSCRSAARSSPCNVANIAMRIPRLQRRVCGRPIAIR
jgi:hypothetical protein